MHYEITRAGARMWNTLLELLSHSQLQRNEKQMLELEFGMHQRYCPLSQLQRKK